MKTGLFLFLLLSVASVARPQPIVGESLQETITRERLEREIRENRRQEDANSWRLHMDHQNQDNRLDALRRRMEDALPDER